MQKPFFAEAGFDLDRYFAGDFVFGTLNLSIAPAEFRLRKPEVFLPGIKWSPVFPAENFYLSPALILHDGSTYRALLYVPDPATKVGHFQPPSVIEVIAQRVAGIRYDDETTLVYNPEAVAIDRPKAVIH